MPIRRFAITAGFALIAGCGTQAPPPADAPPVVVAAAAPPTDGGGEPRRSQEEVRRPTPVEPFRYAGDRGGKQVEKALAPTLPGLPPLPGTAGPKSRTSDAERGELPLPKPRVVAAPLPLVARKTTFPTPPVEHIPTDLGRTAVAMTPMPVAPLARGPTPSVGAAELPPLARPVPDRAPTDDPTAELSTARIVNTLLPVPALVSPFLRLVLPDPFELAEQVRPPARPELGTTPVTVPPARP